MIKAKLVPFLFGGIVLAIVLLTALIVLVITRKPAGAMNIMGEPPVIRVAVSSGNPEEPPIYPKKNPEYPVINVGDSKYQQLGVLTAPAAAGQTEPTVLPLFGRRSPTRRDRYEYYTSTDKMHLWRVTVKVDDRDCQDEVACRELYDGDKVYVPVYEKEFTASIYKYRTPEFTA